MLHACPDITEYCQHVWSFTQAVGTELAFEGDIAIYSKKYAFGLQPVSGTELLKP